MVIIYTSNTGFTAQYAQLLGQETGYPVHTLQEGRALLPRGTQAIYLGWLMAGHISGLDKAGRHFQIMAACGVGMTLPSQRVLENLARSNFVAGAPLFYFPGGYAPEKLKGLKRTMLNLVLRGMRQQLASKPSRSEADYRQLELCTKGGSLVDVAHLAPLLNYLQAQS